ncbi:sensor histidine kinase [Streptomyces malaysiensis]|uniref:sensor histidine kinase n=1 Tax=Streptomyces malaysiensis TaxID=92644 RepID=UPI002B27EC72|nr:HAMP domain-containing sensor histidine kinase [Streptomyces malaysiensis]
MPSAPALLNRHSLRWKFALLVTLACCATALTIGILVHNSTRDRSMNDGAVKALDALSQVLDEYEQTGTPPVGAVMNTEVMPDPLARRLRSSPRPGRVLPGSEIPKASSTAGTAHDRRVTADEEVTWYDSNPNRPRMWAARTYHGDPLATSVDMTPDLLTRQALDRHMWKYALVALAMIVPLSLLLAELPHRRLRHVARTALRIADGDLTSRISAGGGRGDEIREISTALDAMADSLHGRLKAEQRFTADVAHELRTPLMGLVTASGLLDEGEAADLVRNRVEALRTLVEELLEISRLDAGAESAELRPVPLAEVVADSLARTGLPVRFAPTAAPLAETDPRRLDRIVTNLVVNAHRHGGGLVEVRVTATTVTVRDHGPGFPAELLAQGPQRFRTGSVERGRGHGLGLTIALGQAQVIGAGLDFANAPDGGAVATLRLPAASRSART